jgi:hypothetical protein
MTSVANVTIQSSQVTADLTDFPLLVDLSDMPAGFWSTVADGGGDIRVFKADGTTELAREVVACDTATDTGELWIKYEGTLSSSINTTIQIHADGASSDYAVTATYGRNNVWTGYAAVYHMEQDPSGSAPQIIDSSGSGTDLTSNGSMTTGDSVAGPIGTALDFDGNDYLQAGASVAPDGASELTLSAYVKSAAIGNDLSIIGTTAGTFDDNNLGIRYDSEGFSGGGTNVLKFAVENQAGAVENGETASFSQTTNKQSLVLTWVSGEAPKLYTDGSETAYTAAPGTLSGVVSIPDLYVGRGLRDASGLWEGAIDEVRLAATALTADRIVTEYNNQSSPSTFYIASAPTVATPVNPSITNLLATSARLNWEQG